MRGKTILITGACGDIGRSLGREFARRGARLALCDVLPPRKARALLPDLTARTGKFLYGAVDVTDAAAMRRFVAKAERALGPITLCIANAGIVERGALLELPPAAWRRTLEVNLTGCFVTAQAAAQAMVAGGRGGHIVFTGSWTQDQPRDGIGAYCVSKSGLKMLAKCLALELGPNGVRVNVVAAGWVDAGLTAKNLAAHPHLRAEMERQVPLGRLMPVDDFARAVRLFCADEAGYVTGTTLLVDGGASLIRRK
jgi:glucose 1-dehydrogenase